MRTIKIWGGAFMVVAGFFMALPVFAASLYLAPASGNYYVGRSFTVAVDVSSADQAMNAAQGEISFPTNQLQVISLSRASSIMTLWVQPPSFSNNDGVINFQGVAVSPGFQGSAGNILTITFLAKNPGSAPLVFLSGSVLANDGKGTNILNGMQGATMQLTTAPAGTNLSGSASVQNIPETTITTNPSISTGTWYNLNAITFNWTLPPGTQGVSYAIASDPNYQLAQVSQGVASGTSFDLSEVGDGMKYFLLSFEINGTWSAPVIKQIDLDRTPPDPFVIVPEDVGNITDTRPAFQWVATDRASGIADYQVQVGNGDWFNASTIQQGSSYILPVQSFTNGRMLTVRAYDNAGNFREESITFQVLSPCSGNLAFCSFNRFVGEWGWFLLVILILLIAIPYGLIYQLVRSRRKFRAEMRELQADMRRDIKRLESSAIDLRPKHQEEIKAELQKDLKKIEKISDE
jgi:hypothetical protein